MADKAGSSKLKSVSYASDGEEDKEPDLDLPLDKLVIAPTKKLLVLNLAGLLVHRAYSSRKASIPEFRPADGVFGKHLVFKRPFCNEFMKFCMERFEVGLWSSAMESNIDRVLEFIMGASRRKLVFIWSQEQCTITKFKSLENKDKPILVKQLKKLWEEGYPALPWRRGKYSASNTLLIDSTPYKALLNPPNTGIFPLPYNPKDVNDDDLGPKGELRVFLEGLADADDVQSYVKEHRIGQPYIASGHPDWEFYSKIVDAYK